jgi:hypothetical protein
MLIFSPWFFDAAIPAFSASGVPALSIRKSLIFDGMLVRI